MWRPRQTFPVLAALSLLAAGGLSGSAGTDEPQKGPGSAAGPFTPSRRAPPRGPRKGRAPAKRDAKKSSPDVDRSVPDDDPPSGAPRNDSASPPGPPDESEKSLA